MQNLDSFLSDANIYIQVQHLIERCLILHMDRDQCIKALSEHAGIRPPVTLTGFVLLNFRLDIHACRVEEGCST